MSLADMYDGLEQLPREHRAEQTIAPPPRSLDLDGLEQLPREHRAEQTGGGGAGDWTVGEASFSAAY